MRLRLSLLCLVVLLLLAAGCSRHGASGESPLESKENHESKKLTSIAVPVETSTGSLESTENYESKKAVESGKTAGINIGDILENPDEYDGKRVTVSGEVVGIRARVSKAGNPYYTFTLRDQTGEVKVFNFGQPVCVDGDTVAVVGTYAVEKHVGRYTFYNEIDASTGAVVKR